MALMIPFMIKLAISDCACCHSNHRTNLAPFPNWSYTGLYIGQLLTMLYFMSQQYYIGGITDMVD